MRPAVLGVSLIALLAGCGSQSSPLQEARLAGWGTYPPEQFIRVLRTPPAGAYVPIARLSINGASSLDRAQALAAMEGRAQQLGANAIIVTDESREIAPDLAVNPSGGAYNLTAIHSTLQLSGEAIHISHTLQIPSHGGQ